MSAEERRPVDRVSDEYTERSPSPMSFLPPPGFLPPPTRWFRVASWIFGRRFISLDPLTGLLIKGRYWRGVTLITDAQRPPSKQQRPLPPKETTP